VFGYEVGEEKPALPARKVPLVDHHALGFDSDPTREENLQRSLPLVSCRDLAWTLRRISSVGCMNKTLRILFLAFAVTMTLVVLASSAAAGHLPRPLRAGHQRLSAGVHVLDLVSREQGRTGPRHLPRIAIETPSGWFNYDGWGMNDGGTLIVSFWDVAKVYPTGCKWRSKPMIDPGRSVGGLASALATRPLRHASRPRNVALGGYHGKYLEWSVPGKVDFAQCGQGFFESWTAKGWGSDRYQQGGGQVDRLWILDVKGERLVIDAAYMPWATRRQRAELDRVVHSIAFVPDDFRRLVSATFGGGVSAVSVAGINDRGQIVGNLTTEDGGNSAYVWRKGSLRMPWGTDYSSRRTGTRFVHLVDAINDRGQILAEYGDRAVLWENGGTRQIRLGSVWALNDRGQVLGGNLVADPIRGGYASAPELWANEKVTALPLAPGYAAFNDRGGVVGNTTTGNAGVWHDGKLIDLGPGNAWAINNRGEILGSRGNDVVVWRDGIATDIGPGRPVALNNRGQVIGVGPGGPLPQGRAFLWSNGRLTDLGAGYPTAISESGQVVGYSVDRNGLQHGFLWQHGTRTRLPAPKGWAGYPTRATAINDHDQIVGDDCIADCGDRNGPPNRFAVLWTVRGHRIKTLEFLGRQPLPRR
jgi:probable HAF family extracellular repeat protein